MDKFFENVEIVLIVMLILLAVSSIIAGAITGMIHCFIVAIMSFTIVYAYYLEYKAKTK